MIYRLEITLRAREDLDSLAEWIANDNREAARRLFDKVGELAQALVRFPRLGGLKTHRRRAGEYRNIPVPTFPRIILVYEVSDRTETIIVHRILHGSRNLRS